MTEGNFVDYVKIFVTSGNGGKGSVHLHREKYITKGGPDGGDGGRGGHIILRGNSNYWTLLHLKFKRHFKAEHGGHGSKSRSTGADGSDVFIDVPLGTVVRDSKTNDIIFEITDEAEEKIKLFYKGNPRVIDFCHELKQTVNELIISFVMSVESQPMP